MTMKKIAALAAAAVMICSCMGGCGNKASEAPAEETTAIVTEAAPVHKDIRDIPSIELVKEMKIGWNLGNTLDSQIEGWAGDETAERWETAWGNPVTTKPMIDQVKAQGFNVLRVPVTWDGKFGEGPDYTVREDWLERVKEVVDYGIDNDMFVILNMHHEEWHMPTAENKDTAEAIIRSVWKQIAEYFEGYDEHLIFEGMNEPRLKGTPLEWTGGNEESREIINELDAAFVETVRSTGGNNEKRHLMIPGYAASSSENVLRSIKVPDDDKVIVSVHAYLPYSFALADNGTTEWSADNPADTNDIDILFLQLKDIFLDNNRAVIIGEFGTRNRLINKTERAECARYYLTKAKEAGVPCVWWDNNAFTTGEAFGLFDRKTFEWRFPDIMKAMMDTVNE